MIVSKSSGICRTDGYAGISSNRKNERTCRAVGRASGHLCLQRRIIKHARIYSSSNDDTNDVTIKQEAGSSSSSSSSPTGGQGTSHPTTLL